MTDMDPSIPDKCPYCGRERSQWIENDGQGVTSGGLAYCSHDCLARDQARG